MGDNKILDTEERARKAAVAHARFHEAATEIAAEQRFGGPNTNTSEIEIMEEATRLVKEARMGE
jgi:hypothetical protein